MLPGGAQRPHGGDEGVAESETVVAAQCRGLAGKAGVVQRGKERNAGAVAGEHAPGAVGAVRTGGQSHQPQAGVHIAKAGDRLPPIVVIFVSAAFFTGNSLAPFDQPGTGTASNDIVIERLPGIVLGQS